MQYTPERHQIVDIPFVDFLRRTFPGVEGLFVYRHRETQNFVVSKWLNRGRGWIIEIFNLGPSPALINSEMVQQLRFRLSPFARLTKRDIERIAAEQEGLVNQKADEINEDWAKTHRKKTTVGYGSSDMAA